jgi:hypothetical protein
MCNETNLLLSINKIIEDNNIKSIKYKPYANERRKEDEVNTDLVSQIGNASVMRLTFHSTKEVRKPIPVYTKLKNRNIHVSFNYY